MKNFLIALLAVAVGTGCSLFRPDAAPEPAPIEPGIDGPPPASPAAVPPGPAGDSTTWWVALAADERRIVVSKEARWLWVVEVDSTLFKAPVAIGRDTTLRHDGQTWELSLPVGRLTVLGKDEDPEWVPPDWYYYGRAAARGLDPVQLPADTTIYLTDYTWLHVRDGEVGRVDRFGYWRLFDPGRMLEFQGSLFLPPPDSPQRPVPGALGTRRLVLSDGSFIRGTPLTDAVGPWASHGSIRLSNPDIETLYGMVEPGTTVYIY